MQVKASDCTVVENNGSAHYMSAARTERLLNLLTLLLNARKPVTFSAIRDLDEFAAYRSADPKSGERAFERDKAALIELGIPLSYVMSEGDGEELGGYVLDTEAYFLPALKLSATEQAMLSLASVAALGNSHFPLRSALVRAVGKLGFDVDPVFVLNDGGQLIDTGPMGVSQARFATGHSGLQLGANAELVWGHMKLLQGAVAKGQQVEFHYHKPNANVGAQNARCLSPYGVYYRQGMWYVVGHCHERSALRTFHVGRMRGLRLAFKTKTNSFSVPESFDLSAHAQQMPWAYGPGELVDVVVRLAAKLVPATLEIFGHEAEVDEARDERGSALVRIKVRDLKALMATLLPFGAAAEVLEPPELRSALGVVFASLHARYTETIYGAGV